MEKFTNEQKESITSKYKRAFNSMKNIMSLNSEMIKYYLSLPIEKSATEEEFKTHISNRQFLGEYMLSYMSMVKYIEIIDYEDWLNNIENMPSPIFKTKLDVLLTVGPRKLTKMVMSEIIPFDISQYNKFSADTNTSININVEEIEVNIYTAYSELYRCLRNNGYKNKKALEIDCEKTVETLEPVLSKIVNSIQM